MAFIALDSSMGHEVTELLQIQRVSDYTLWQGNPGAKQDLAEYIV